MITLVTTYPDHHETLPFLVRERSGVFLRADSPFWMIRFSYKGRLIRESSKLTSRQEAIVYRKRRMAEFGIGPEASCSKIPTLADASQSLLTPIAAAHKRGYAQVRAHLKSIVAHFGSETRIAEILPERMDRFVIARRAAGLKDSSVYNEMSTLRRCLRLQWRRNHLLALPEFPMPTRGKARQGFFTLEEVECLCRHLPPHAVNAVRFAWETGWRRGEIFGLRWRDVDWKVGVIFLGDSKNGEPRQLPFAESEVLTRIIREQRASASGFELRRSVSVEHVFHYAGRRLPEGLRRCWGSACRKAGIEGRLFHDLRRSFIQRCEDLNVARSSAMKITGHKTEAVYSRYAIAPRASIALALQTLANSEQNQSERDARNPKTGKRLRRQTDTL